MQAHYPFSFEREMGCTATQLQGWLPGAGGDRKIEWHDGSANIELEGGCVSIAWQECEPRRVALIVLPRLRVRFAARHVDDSTWQRFMRHFDLHTQRGGG
jgi:hypothetical protein